MGMRSTAVSMLVTFMAAILGVRGVAGAVGSPIP
jgi:archaellum component FlaG (FlaF/FlaG flagellin family)